VKTPLSLLGLAALAASLAIAAEPTSLPDARAQGKNSLTARLRSEHVEQTGLLDADALTLRTRLGYTTAKAAGWQFSAEAENVAALDGDAYNQSGLNPAAARRAVVADPEITELNQLWLAFTRDKTTATLGRQKLIFDNARFVGDVGWRQNQQTFDAFTLQDKSLAATTLTYAYVDQVNRVFSRRHAQGRWDSDSHLLNASYVVSPAATVTAYAYRLKFTNSAANSCATYGVSAVGTQPLTSDFKFTYRAELATQSDAGPSPLRYSALYDCFEAGLAHARGSLTLGHELLGSDHNVGFKTPLATLHAFNGWADLFLATPAAGLRDVYLKATANLPQAIALTAFEHWFETAKGGADLGSEFDVMLSRKFGARVAATAKFAEFNSGAAAYPDVRKIWLQLDFTY
jgi:hypothetical protein